MRAKEARKRANKANEAKKVEKQEEVDKILSDIAEAADNGEFSITIRKYLSRKSYIRRQLERRGYFVTPHSSVRNESGFTTISWKRDPLKENI